MSEPRRTQVLVPLMAAAGMSKEAIIATEAAMWAAPPAYYAYKKYTTAREPENKNLTYNQMAKGLRKNPFIPKKKTYVPAPRRGGPNMRMLNYAPMYRTVQSYHDPANDHDNKWVNIRDIKTIELVQATDHLGKIGLNDLQAAPMFKKFSLMYGKVRVKKITVVFNEGLHLHQVLTSVSAIDANVPASQDELLKEPSMHAHNLGQSRMSKFQPQRTFNLFQSNKDFTDWTATSTSDLNAELGTGATPGSKKAVIKYAFTGAGYSGSGNTTRCELTISYLCEFCNLNDLTSINGTTV